MVVSGAREAESVSGAERRAVIWHELECGSYAVDLPLWLELADESRARTQGGPILDIGAGSGRVALALARAGHAVTALDLDEALLGQLARAAGPLPIETARADAREFTLARRDYALCIAPMQTVQLLGGPAGRVAFMRRVREHLLPGAQLACAIVTELEPFDCTAGGPSPSPETLSADGLTYVSRAVRVALTRRGARIERERSIEVREHGRTRVLHGERDVIELDRVSVAGLRQEGRAAGFEPAGPRTIAETDEHVGSRVVVLRA